MRRFASEVLGPTDSQIVADLAGEEIVYLAMAWYCGRPFDAPIHVDSVVVSLAQELASVAFEMANQVDALHATGSAKSSRITSIPAMDSSASWRLASRTRANASDKFSRASSRVLPCVFAPGTSSMNAIKPSETFWKIAVSLKSFITTA